jgi:hypothetical protein
VCANPISSPLKCDALPHRHSFRGGDGVHLVMCLIGRTQHLQAAAAAGGSENSSGNSTAWQTETTLHQGLPLQTLVNTPPQTRKPQQHLREHKLTTRMVCHLRYSQTLFCTQRLLPHARKLIITGDTHFLRCVQPQRPQEPTVASRTVPMHIAAATG